MAHNRPINDHNEYEALIAAAVLGSLDAADHARLVDHLRGCAACRADLGRQQAIVDAVSRSVEPMAPSAALRARLAAQVTKPAPEVQRAATPTAPANVIELPAQNPWARRAVWIAAAAAILLVGLLTGVLISDALRDDGPALTLREVALESPAGLNLDQAKLVFIEETSTLRFTGTNLPAPPDDHVYQVWLIEDGDNPPIPSGTVDLQTGEYASMADLSRHRVFAITAEPGPVGSGAPTTDILIVGHLPEPAG